jgi:hypothetical protein
MGFGVLRHFWVYLEKNRTNHSYEFVYKNKKINKITIITNDLV